jgi:nucleoside-diphosphate-sugar epimerase
MRIAILGSSSQIAKDLICLFSKFDEHDLILFARNPEIVDKWLEQNGLMSRYKTKLYEAFGNQKPYDLVINFVGVSNPTKLIEMENAIFDASFFYDNMCLDYVKKNPNCLYLFLSSGAIYGSNFEKPVEQNTKASISINNIQPQDWYGFSKLYAECRHRFLRDYSIVDIRVFNYFSHTIDMSARYFITEIARAIKDKNLFITSKDDFVRDYLHPWDLYQLINKIIKNPNNNCAVDCYSKAPIKKTILLQELQKRFDLKYKMEDLATTEHATGQKNLYYSLNQKALEYGYKPKFTSLEGICAELNLYLHETV